MNREIKEGDVIYYIGDYISSLTYLHTKYIVLNCSTNHDLVVITDDLGNNKTVQTKYILNQEEKRIRTLNELLQ